MPDRWPWREHLTPDEMLEFGIIGQRLLQLNAQRGDLMRQRHQMQNRATARAKYEARKLAREAAEAERKRDQWQLDFDRRKEEIWNERFNR
jgi:hypothetical protein